MSEGQYRIVALGYNYFRQCSPLLNANFLESFVPVHSEDAGLWDQAEGPPVALAAGGHFSLALTKKGDVYVWGTLQDKVYLGVERIDFGLPNKVQIATFSAGWRHAGAVSTDGHVYTWGSADHGCLGHGNADFLTVPKRVEYFINASQGKNPGQENFEGSICQISCGGMHTGVLTTDGSVFMFGLNNKMQCGQRAKNQTFLPSKLNLSTLDPSETVAQLFCGRQHSMLLTQNGAVYSWGCNKFYQLGCSDAKVVGFPKLVELLNGSRTIQECVKLSLGWDHTLALTALGYLIGWGSNAYNQLLAQDRRFLPPSVIIAGRTFCDVQASKHHSLAVSSVDNSVSTWGVPNGGAGLSPGHTEAEEAAKSRETITTLEQGCSFVAAALGEAHALLLVEKKT